MAAVRRKTFRPDRDTDADNEVYAELIGAVLDGSVRAQGPLVVARDGRGRVVIQYDDPDPDRPGARPDGARPGAGKGR